MAVVSRVTRQASASSPSPTPSRAKLTERQRNLKSERTNIRLKGATKIVVAQKTGRVARATTRQQARSAIVVKREAGRITRENQASGTVEQNRREEFRTGQAQVRIGQREEAILHRFREGIGIRRSERLQRQLIEEPTVGVVKPATNSIILLVTTMFLLIILYAIVTHSEGLSGALAGISNVIATFTQPGPLFTKRTQ